MSARVTITLSDDALILYARWLATRHEVDMRGEMGAHEREELRSYAAEFMVRLLSDNPDVFSEYAEHRAMITKSREASHG